MKNYELASKELYEFEEALKKAKDAAMEVEWFSAFISIISSSGHILSDGPPKDVKSVIERTDKKLGM